MTVFKCKMCGSPLEVAEGASTATCEYCRTQQTLPRLDDDRRANLYDRGNHFRRASEYDKAMRTFEAVLAEDPSDAEAYWSIVLCRFGVEYVQDPATGRQVPTVNRMQSSSILADEDYKRALENADALQRGIYEEQAREIARIQEGIAQVAAKEEPFDVFICYKETGADGRRTRDSVKAGELYHALTSEGFRVFYAPVTLEDKLGQAYEPYIYSALQSSSAMVVIGSKAEHFAAPWVRNEWSRYLALIKAGARKTLIPAYFDMDPYDLPEEFSHLQAQDMSKIGFLQDLVRGIKKVCGRDERLQAAPVVSAPATGASGTAAPLLKRAEMFLADGEWDRAEEYAERVLDIDPTCAEAYLVKEMRSHKCSSWEELVRRTETDVLDDDLYMKAAEFATGDFAKVMANIRAEVLKAQFVRAENNARAQLLLVLGEVLTKRQCTENDARIADARAQAEALVTSRGESYVDYDGSLEAECERVRRSISDLAGWHGAAAALAACDKGVRLARRSVADDRARKAKEQLQKAKETFNAGGADSADVVEAELARIKDSLSDVCEWASVQGVMKECNMWSAECRRSVRNARIRAVEAAQSAAQSAVRKEIQSANWGEQKTLFIGCIAVVVIAAGIYSHLAAVLMAGFVAVIPVVAVYMRIHGANRSSLKLKADQLKTGGSYSAAAIAYDELGMAGEALACRKAWAGQLRSDRLYSVAAIAYDELGMDDEALACNKKAALSDAEVGDTVLLGSYEQDNDTSDGAEPIEWAVLDKQGGKALLVSKYALDCKPYNDVYEDVTWETCTLRSWLNGEFYETAFSETERALVAQTTNSNPDNAYYGTEGGADTTDSVFLLSIDEAEKYFSSDDGRVCYPTDYAVSQGAWTNSDTGACSWWLRSPGRGSGHAAIVCSGGSVDSYGWGVVNDGDAVRPALWVNL
jgi:tetratricopeptide (TPR) repeat protein